MLMSLFNSSCCEITFGLGVATVVCDRDKERTTSVDVVDFCDGDVEGGETSMTFSTSDDSDG